MTDIPLSRHKGSSASVTISTYGIALARWHGGEYVANSIYNLTANEAADLAAALAKASGMELRCFARLVALGEKEESTHHVKAT